MLLGESKLSLFKRERTQRRQLTFSQETLAETLVEGSGACVGDASCAENSLG
jgi:hypothetical protein